MLEIKSIPAFNDNYIWLIQNNDKRCAVVDPGDAKPVLEYLHANELTLEAILITHHHNDHIGGVPDLVHAFPDVTVVALLPPPPPPLPLLFPLFPLLFFIFYFFYFFYFLFFFTY